ncbi:MAG: type II CAAX endopeptidase family protein [Gammaproteobacteria bacterium]
MTTILSYSFLYLSVILLWVPLKKILPLWGYPLIAAVIFALISGVIDPMGLVFIGVFAVSAYVLQAPSFAFIWRFIAGLLVLVLGFALIFHFIPGFNNLKVLDKVQFSQDTIPFTLYLNFDKTMVGLFILAFSYSLIANRKDWLSMLKRTWPYILPIFAVILVLSFVFGYVRFDFKIPSSILIWALTNLLFVSMAEEAYFRGFVQKYLQNFLNFRYGHWVAILIAASFFGLMHFPGGIQYIILSTVAGVGYGWVYFRTGRIEASIITHFSLNLTHFVFFSYPALSPG